MLFADRIEGGKALAYELPSLTSDAPWIVLAIARGGIPVGCSLATELRLPIDILFATRIPMIGQPHLGSGAITITGEKVYNRQLLNSFGLRESHFFAYEQQVLDELKAAARQIRSSAIPPSIAGKNVILTDDGISSGYTMLAAIRCVRKHGARKVIVAVPVSSFAGYKLVDTECDDFIALRICSDPHFSIESYYANGKVDLERATRCVQIARTEGVAAF